MSIIYSLVATNQDKVLCEYTDYHGNFEQFSRNLLKKVEKDRRAIFSFQNSFNFHYLNENNITYMCMSDSDFPVEAETAFLIEVQRVFTTTFSNETIANAYAYSLNKDFKDILKAKMEYYNTNKENADLIGKLKSNLHSMKDDLIDVADVLSQRGDKVNLIVKRAMALKEESMSYYQNAVKVKKTVIRRRIMMIIFGVLILIILAYFISVIACGGFDYKGCRSDN